MRFVPLSCCDVPWSSFAQLESDEARADAAGFWEFARGDYRLRVKSVGRWAVIYDHVRPAGMTLVLGRVPLSLWSTWSLLEKGCVMGKFTDQMGKVKAAVAKGGKATDKWLMTAFPAIWDFLTDQSETDGKPRQTTTFLFFVQDGQFKVCVKDRQNGLQAFVSASGAQDVVEAIEAGLRNATLDWRDDPFAKGGKGKRKT